MSESGDLRNTKKDLRNSKKADSTVNWVDLVSEEEDQDQVSDSEQLEADMLKMEELTNLAALRALVR